MKLATPQTMSEYLLHTERCSASNAASCQCAWEAAEMPGLLPSTEKTESRPRPGYAGPSGNDQQVEDFPSFSFRFSLSPHLQNK